MNHKFILKFDLMSFGYLIIKALKSLIHVTFDVKSIN